MHATQPMLAGKITGMFLYEMDDIELAYLIDNTGALDDMIREALDVLGGGGIRGGGGVRGVGGYRGQE